MAFNLIPTICASVWFAPWRGEDRAHEAAGQFDVSVSFVVKLMQRVQATGSFKAGYFGGHKEPKLAQHARPLVRELVEQAPSATLLELQKKLNERRRRRWGSRSSAGF